MKKYLPIIIVGVAILAVFLMKSDSEISPIENLNNVEVKEGIQYITIDAKGGYSPRVTNAKADIPTKLIVKTSGTYDCSAALMVRSAGFQKILPQTGETEIDLGVPKTGETKEGICSMGMYSFLINFN